MFDELDFSSVYLDATYKLREYPAGSDYGEVVYGSAPCSLAAWVSEDRGYFYHELKQ